MTKMIAALGISAALAFAAPSTAEAQGPIVTGGLVNVTIVDAVDVRNVKVAIGAALNLAANVCGVAVNVLAVQLGQPGPISCTNTVTGDKVTITQM